MTVPGEDAGVPPPTEFSPRGRRAYCYPLGAARGCLQTPLLLTL